MPAAQVPTRFPDRSDLRAHTLVRTVDDCEDGWMVASWAAQATSKDPHYRIELPQLRAVYETTPSGNIELRARVHHADDDQAFAGFAAKAIARLMHLHRVRLGRPAQFPRSTPVADIWVVPTPAADPNVGGESRTSHVYLWDCRYRRTQSEWARTVTHEWGHLTLPAARGFAAPESDAAGHLGEALYLEWLAQDSLPDEPGNFATPSVARRWSERHNHPRRQRYEQLGPRDTALDQRDKSGMDAYVGAALGIAASFGSTTLGAVLRGIESDSPRELLASLRRLLADEDQILVRLPAWVPLPAGQYAIQPAAGSGTLELDTQRPKWLAAASTERFAKSDWHRLHAGPGSLAAVSISRTHSR